MAVETTLSKSSLSLRYKDGVDAQGNDLTKVKKFSNVKVTAVNDNLYAVAAAFSPLMKYPVVETLRSDDSTIMSL